MPSKFYHENWQKCNEWIHEQAPSYVKDCMNEVFAVLQRAADRKTDEIDFLYGLIEKYLVFLPDEAKAELIAHYNSQKLVGDMVEVCNAETNPPTT